MDIWLYKITIHLLSQHQTLNEENTAGATSTFFYTIIIQDSQIINLAKRQTCYHNTYKNIIMSINIFFSNQVFVN